MPKFRDYITEKSVADWNRNKTASDIDNIDVPTVMLEKLKKDCKPYLKVAKKNGYVLWRGNEKEIGTMGKVKRRKDRRPLSMKKWIHDILNKLFYEKFGWKPRSEGVFAVTDQSSSWTYGKPYGFFPIGSYRYVWSPDVRDLWTDSTMFEVEIPGEPMTDKEMKIRGEEILKSLMDRYTDKKLDWAMKSKGHEIMFDVDNYYLVNRNYVEYVREALL